MLNLFTIEPGIAAATTGAYALNHEFNVSRSSAILKSEIVETVKKLSLSIIEGYEALVKPIQEVLVFQHIVQIYKVPYALVDIVKNRRFFSEKDRDIKIDKGLKVCNHVREIVESIGAFIVGLEKTKAISFPLNAFATPFAAFISFLSIGAMITKYRSNMKVLKFMHSLNESEETGKVNGKVTQLSYQTMVDLIEEHQDEDEKFICEMFNTTEEKLMDSLDRIRSNVRIKLSSCKTNEVEEGQKILEIASSGLKGRVKKNFISSNVSLVASMIALIGTVILLAIPTLTIGGWIMLGFGVVVDIEQFIYHKITEYRFAKAIDLKRTNWEWMTC